MTTYVCPIHPDIRSNTQTTCAKCGMKLQLREQERVTRSRKEKVRPIRK